MKTFIKLIAVAVAAFMVFALVACDKNAEEIAALEEEIAALEEEIEELEDELKEAEDDEDEDAIADLEEEIKDKEAELEELEDELKELKDGGKKDKKDKKSSDMDEDVVEAVENYFDAMYSADVEAMLELSLDPYAMAYYMDKEDLDDEDEVFEYFEDLMDALEEQDAEIEVEEMEDMDEDDFADLVENLVDNFDYEEDAIEGAKTVTISTEIEFEGEKTNISIDETVVCIDGDWYLLGRTVLAGSVALESDFED
ncbi:MAG: hypothetical protein IJC81_00500 [Clostridia bacterium]|nr:hypothetical protein [Clostridia bacterium]